MQIKYKTNVPTQMDSYRLAITHHQQKQYAKAKALYLEVLKQQPERAEVLVNLASVCDALHEYEEALSYVNQALRVNPDVRDGCFNKGIILQHLYRYEEAVAIFQINLKLFPQNHDSHYYLGKCYAAVGEYQQALECYKKASDIVPSLVSIYGAGQCYVTMDCYKAAVVCFTECLKIDPTFQPAQFQLFACYKQLHEYAKLIPLVISVRQVTDLTLEHQNDLLFVEQEMAFWSHYSQTAKQLAQKIEEALAQQRKSNLGPWTSIILPISLSSRLSLAKMYAHNIEAKYQSKRLTLNKKHHQRLRIGYLSMDFRVHALGFLTQNIFALHDRTRFEVFAYSYGQNDGSDVRKAIEQGVEHFVDLQMQSVSDAAKRIADDEIDILIDLAGYTANNRFGIVALRPAPIQVNYLGYCLSTGSDAIDYFLGDKVIIQSQEEALYSEKIVYLPNTFIVLNHQEALCDEYVLTRTEFNLPNDVFVYGCFNATYKIEPQIFDVWLDILKAVPKSVLWLLSRHEIVEMNLRSYAKERGVDPTRLVFAPNKDRAEHLARHKHMDLFLDTLQVNAVTTACDAIYAGVPVLTLAGDYILSRAGKSIMQAAGPLSFTQQFIAENLEDYKQKAIDFGLHPDFPSIKAQFQRQLPQSPLLDVPGKITAFETAFEKMWERHQQGMSPQSFSIE